MSTTRSNRDFAGSLYKVNGRWVYTYRLPGAARPKTERLGINEKNAQKRARHVSDVIDQLKSRIISLDDAQRSLDAGKLIGEDVRAYEKYLTNKGVDAHYVAATLSRVREAVTIMNVSRTRQLSPAKVETMIERLRTRKRKRGDGKPGGPDARVLSTQTIQHFVRAVKQFTGRMKKLGRLAFDPLSDVEGVRVIPNDHRDASEEEVRWLVKAGQAAKIKKWNEMRGSDRAMLYVFAWTTGLRKSELRSAQVSWLKMDDEQPGIAVPAEYTKNGKPAFQPMPRWLVEAAKTWIGDRTGILFPRMPDSMHRMFGKDREAGRQLYLDGAANAKERSAREGSEVLIYRGNAGRLVFHSLRHGYVSIFANSEGVPAKVVQELARHSDIRLTMNRYAHTRGNTKSTAVDRFVPNIITGGEAGSAETATSKSESDKDGGGVE